jgi:glycerol-3-phosphate dehydrogenase (NAD(P)+)
VEVAGAVKNVMAIAAGIADGLGFGHNTRAAIISRGLAEMTRLGIHKGAHATTFMGLAGVGDLVLTCTGDLSRNRTVGLKLGGGQTLQEILTQATQVAEGVNTTRAMHFLSQKLGVEMPIVEAVYQILYEDRPAKATVAALMGRPLRAEKG